MAKGRDWPKVLTDASNRGLTVRALARELGELLVISSHPPRPSTARVSARDEPRIDPDRELPSEVRKEP